ncbi:MAG: hypothetical protein ACLGI9_17150 [Thermoanaerobaculia bacterium]
MRATVWKLLPVLAVLVAGPARAGEFRFLVDGEAGVTDSNYDDAGEGVQVNDYESIARAALDLRLSYALQRWDLALSYSPAYERSLENSDLAGTSHRLAFGLAGELTRRLRLSVQERLYQTPDLNPYQPVSSPETIAVTQRGDQLAHSLDVSLNHDLTRRTGLTLGLTHGRRSYEEDDLFDSESLGARFGIGWTLTPDRRIDATAGLGRFEYENRNEADVRTLGVGFSRELGRDGQMSVDAGYWSVEQTLLFDVTGLPLEQPLEEEETGWRGGLQLSHGRELFRWALGYSHDVSPGAGLGRAAEVDNLFAGISTSLGRSWTFGLDANASRQDDLLADSSALAGSTGQDVNAKTEFLAGTAHASWNLGQILRLTGGYTRVWQRAARETPFEDLSYDRLFLGIGIRIYDTGETPTEPALVGESSDEEPDSQ